MGDTAPAPAHRRYPVSTSPGKHLFFQFFPALMQERTHDTKTGKRNMDVPDTVCLKQPITGQRLCLPFCCREAPPRTRPHHRPALGHEGLSWPSCPCFRRSLKQPGHGKCPGTTALSFKAQRITKCVCSFPRERLRLKVLKDSLHAGPLNCCCYYTSPPAALSRKIFIFCRPLKFFGKNPRQPPEQRRIFRLFLQVCFSCVANWRRSVGSEFLERAAFL